MVSFHIIGTPAKVKCAVDCVQIHANKWRSFKWKIAKLFYIGLAKHCPKLYNKRCCDLTDDDAGDCYTKEVGNSCGECPIQETGRQVTVLNEVCSDLVLGPGWNPP